LVTMPEASRKKRHIIAKIAWLFLVAFAVGLCGLIVGYFNLSSDLPSIEIINDFRPSLASLVYDNEGNKVHEFFIERRIWTPIDEIPEMMQNAIIAVEDSRFYDHHGVDWIGIVRAAWANIRYRRIKQGASTITQQLARRLFLTPEQTYTRKIKEMILALRIERELADKHKIMEYYLNEIYFGSGAYGVAAAAQVYFQKPLKDLSTEQFAMLAGLPRSPSRYSPFVNADLALRRRNIALRRMAEERLISSEQCADYIALPLSVGVRESIEEIPVGGWFFEHIRRSALKIFKIAVQEDEASENKLYSGSAMDVIYRDGLNIYTTVDLKMQAVAEEAVRYGLRRLDKRQGFRGPVEGVQIDEALTKDKLSGGLKTYAKVTELSDTGIAVAFGKELTGIIPPKRFKWALDANRELGLAPDDMIEVMIGPKYKSEDEMPIVLWLEQEPIVEGALVAIDLHTGYVKAMVGGRSFGVSEFNRVIQSRRQPGSAFKPVIYTAAIDTSMVPTDIILDVPVYKDEVDKVWKPKNYGERVYGPITLQTALEKSKNLATVNLINRISPHLAVKYARILGIESNLQPVPSLALGSIGVSLLELTCLYGVFPDGGRRFHPVFIKRITDHKGREIFADRPSFDQVLSPQTAYVMTHMLRGVIQRGTGVRAKRLGHNLGGKTGTSNDFADAWFLGFSSDLVVGSWVGFDDMTLTLGKQESGARAALPIWIKFMESVLKDEPVKEYVRPEGIVLRMVDAKTGLLATDRTADAILEAFVAGTEPTKLTAKNLPTFTQIDAGL